MPKKWYDTGYLRAKPKEVDAETGIIKGVKVCSAGEAKGHGVHLDKEFIETVTSLGNASNRGLKARFGHPTMCSESLGTFIGRFKNFSMGRTTRDDGSLAWCCFADLHLSETAKDAPNGDLYSYVLAMAENEADMFGTSIVFTAGLVFKRNDKGEKVFPYDKNGNRNQKYRDIGGPQYIECAKLHACDCVDEPAANDGLFSAFANETIAGQITEFLDLHPQIFEALQESPEVLKALSQYGEKIDEFMSRYTAYKQDGSAPDEFKEEVETMEKETEKAEVETLETKETPERATEEKLSAEDVQKAVDDALALDRKRQAEIRQLGDKFGFTKAAEEFAENGKSADEFRKHILNQSPEDWKASLSIKNPSVQETEKEMDDNAEAQSAVDAIKGKRKAQYGA